MNQIKGVTSSTVNVNISTVAKINEESKFLYVIEITKYKERRDSHDGLFD